MPQTIMTKVKTCVNSTPYKTRNEDAPVSTIYISKSHRLGDLTKVLQEWDDDTVTFKLEAKTAAALESM